MKLTDPDIIKDGEKDLINAIEEDLDLDSINEIIKDNLKVKNFKSKGGKIIVHNNEIAFKITFELSMNGSVMFDRDGNYIPEDNDKNADNNNIPADANDDKTDTVDEIDQPEAKEADIDTGDDLEEDSEFDFSVTEAESDKDQTINKEESPSGKNIARDLVVEDDSADESDTDKLSEIDLDIDGFEDTEEDELDFSDDEDIDDILKESRDFWENKKSS